MPLVVDNDIWTVHRPLHDALDYVYGMIDKASAVRQFTLAVDIAAAA